jgi:hypothetical protein
MSLQMLLKSFSLKNLIKSQYPLTHHGPVEYSVSFYRISSLTYASHFIDGRRAQIHRVSPKSFDIFTPHDNITHRFPLDDPKLESLLRLAHTRASRSTPELKPNKPAGFLPKGSGPVNKKNRP